MEISLTGSAANQHSLLIQDLTKITPQESVSVI